MKKSCKLEELFLQNPFHFSKKYSIMYMARPGVAFVMHREESDGSF